MKSTEEKAAVCPTRLLPDQVATEDAFQHKAIALAIADMVLHEDGGGAIALTGAWGSGKSTVVRFLEAELNESEPHTWTFIFDAWAHQGDPLRRTFLEKLIRWCNDQNPRWITHPKKWDNTIEELARRKETTNSKISPNLTILGAIGAIFLLLVPTALQMYLKNTYAEHRSWDITGFVLSLLPAILATLVFIYWFVTQFWEKKEERRPIPSFISKGTVSDTTSETNKTADPTSVEFEKHYCDLLTEAMAGNHRRLVIVIDNLDRIAHNDARSIWATLRVFFDPSVDQSAGWHKRVWVLVPFDTEAINDLWETPPENKKLRPTMSRNFLEKTFQASFRVPPIILSNWQSFLVTQLRSAFPGASHTNDEFHTIFRLYDRLKPKDNRPPTPRNLKLFVNKIGALHRQWHDEIPLPQQAAFALISDDKPEEVVKTLLGSDSSEVLPTITHVLSSLLGPNWRVNLAALFFNLPPAKATEILLFTGVSEALKDGNADNLAAQEKLPGFPAALESAIEDAHVSKRINSDELARIAVAFSGLTQARPEYERCRTHIYHAATFVKQWQPFNESVAGGIGRVGEIIPTGRDLLPIIQSIRASLNAQTNAKEWCEAITLALPPFIARDENAVKIGFRIQAPAAQFLTIVGEAQATGKFTNLWRYMQPSAPTDEVMSILAKQAQEGRWDDNAADIVRSLRQINNSWNWKSLVASLQVRVQNVAQTMAEDLPASLGTLFYLSDEVKEARAALQAASGGEVPFQQFYFLTQADNQAAAAIYVFVLVTSNAQLQPIPRQQSMPNTPQWRAIQGKQALLNFLQNPSTKGPLLKELSAKCTSWLALDKWRETAQAKPESKKLINEILKGRIQVTNLPTVPTKELIANLDYWTEVVGKDAVNTILSQKAASYELAQALLEIPFSPKDQQLHLLALEKYSNDKYRAFLADNLRRLSSDVWLTALKSESEIIDTAISLGEGGLRLGQPLQDALDAHVKLKLNDDSSGRLAPKWQEVLGLLERDDHDVFAQRLLGHFTSGTGRIKGLLPYYAPLLSKVVKEDGPTRSIQRIIRIIEAHDAAEVSWLASVTVGWQGGGLQSIRADWRRRAEKCARENVPEDQKEALLNLIDALSLGDESDRV